MKRHDVNVCLCVGASVLLTVIGACGVNSGGGSGSSPAPARPTATPERGTTFHVGKDTHNGTSVADVTTLHIRTLDGETVTCAVVLSQHNGGGLSCDWDHPVAAAAPSLAPTPTATP